MLLLLLNRYFNLSTKSENAAYVLALVLPCRWWSLRTARCLSTPPLGQEALPRSTARPRRHPSFHAGLTSTQKYHEPRAGSPAASTRASRPLTRKRRRRISIFRCRLCILPVPSPSPRYTQYLIPYRRRGPRYRRFTQTLSLTPFEGIGGTAGSPKPSP